MNERAQIGRLAMREEDTLWVAYYAKPGTMEDAVFLGSVQMAFVRRDGKRKEAFMEMMREAVGDAIEDATGARPVWPTKPRRAPEHERAGHA